MEKENWSDSVEGDLIERSSSYYIGASYRRPGNVNESELGTESQETTAGIW